MKITLEEARNSLSMETDCTTEVESVSVEIGELCSKVEAFDSSVIVKHQEHRSLKILSLEFLWKKTLIEKKLMALKYSVS